MTRASRQPLLRAQQDYNTLLHEITVLREFVTEQLKSDNEAVRSIALNQVGVLLDGICIGRKYKQ